MIHKNHERSCTTSRQYYYERVQQILEYSAPRLIVDENKSTPSPLQTKRKSYEKMQTYT
jgi:hypothetical protein